MKSFKKVAAMIAVTSVLAACGGSSGLYQWNGYSYALLDHYKGATDTGELAEKLQAIVDRSEARGKVPPGVYAELGYAYLDAGQQPQAIIYFTKEYEAWPESRPFLDRILARINNNTAPTIPRTRGD